MSYLSGIEQLENDLNIAHSNLKPLFWCSTCELALHRHEVDEIKLPNEYGVIGSALVRFECGACGDDVVPYNYQDEAA